MVAKSIPGTQILASVTILNDNEPGYLRKMACSSSEEGIVQYGPGKSCFIRKQGIAYSRLMVSYKKEEA